MNFTIVLIIVLVVLAFFQGRLLWKISKFRKLSNAGYDFCIEAVMAHTRGEDWRPIMEKAKVIREEMTAL